MPWLPCCLSYSSAANYSNFTMPASESPPNILLVDDDDAIRNLLVLAAKSRGWQPVTAGTAAEACLQLNAGIKAVVLDHGLPDGEGIQVLERLRKIQPDVPVVMLTVEGSIKEIEEAIGYGAKTYLTKPSSRVEILKAVKSAIS